MENQTQPSRFVKWSLIVGIIIVINMFFNYAVSLVYKAPEYPNSQPQVVEQYKTQEDCTKVGGQWNANVYSDPSIPTKSAPKGSCDPDYTKRMEYEKYRKEYSRNLFMILVALGALIMGLGIVLKEKFEVVAIAFSWSGVLSFLIASMRYWSDANNLFKVLILGAALVMLVWLAISKFSK